MTTPSQACNARYARLNRRFDYRASCLFRLGFRPSFLSADPAGKATVGIWSRSAPGLAPHVISASAVMHADPDCWSDILAEATRFAEIWSAPIQAEGASNPMAVGGLGEVATFPSEKSS